MGTSKPDVHLPIVGHVIMYMNDGARLLRYGNRQNACETTSLCPSLREAMQPLLQGGGVGGGTYVRKKYRFRSVR